MSEKDIKMKENKKIKILSRKLPNAATQLSKHKKKEDKFIKSFLELVEDYYFIESPSKIERFNVFVNNIDNLTKKMKKEYFKRYGEIIDEKHN